MLKNKVISFMMVVILLCFSAVNVFALEQTTVKQKGMSYVTWARDTFSSSSSDASLRKLKETGTEYVALVVTWYQDKFDAPLIGPNPSKTPSDTSVVHAIKTIHDSGMKVMLKPHLDFLDSSEGKWRSDIEFSDDTGWEAWFKNYQDFLMHYIEIANKENIEMFCLGTELSSTTINQPERWKKMIQNIRAVYKGQLTYAANWYKEYDEILFWDMLDYAGIDAYFPLIEKDKPTKEELITAWEPWLKQVEKWQAKINKPVIFSEIGYKSSINSADKPWEHMPGREVDLQLQADCYEVIFELFWNKPWFYGVYWWYWGASPKIGGAANRQFTPQNKPAEDVLKKWYKAS
ncbi:MAG: hypothetical protein AB1472_07315 [Candidatus Omnitrophota bacterium]